MCVTVSRAVAQETGTETTAETTPEEAAPAEVTQVEGPLYVVSTDTAEPPSDQEIREIYREGDQTFLNVFWWWFVLIAGLAGLGAGAWWIWGNRGPRRLS